MKRFYFPALIIFIAILSGWNSSVFAQTTFPVPNVPGCSGVSGVIVTMRGGAGGSSNSSGTAFPNGGAGGYGGAITCTLNVATPVLITSLTYYVGMAGAVGTPVLTGTAGLPGGTGYGTGGNSGNFAGPTGAIGTDCPGGAGGGSSAVLNGGTALLVAAGGGGGGALITTLNGGNGGNPGTAGTNAGTYNYGGSGGTSGTGGAAGGVGLNNNGSPAGVVPPGNGGTGGEGLTGSQSGGGGGAGYGGGGGGGAGNLPGTGTTIGVNTATGAGGGGSNYVNPTAVTTGLTNGTASVLGNGAVSLTLYPAAIVGTCISICPGTTTTFTETTPGGVWSLSNTTIASVSPTTGSPVTVTAGVSAGTATISYTEPSGYYAFVVVTVLAPTPPITGPTSVCVGQTITLSDATSGGVWNSGTPGVATVSAVGVVTGVTAGITVITYTPPSSCPVTYTITVTSSPSPITGLTSVCTGSTITLSDAYGGGTWTSSNTSVATINAVTGVLSGTSPGTTTVTYTLGGTCLVTAIITVNQIAPVTGTTTICLGSTTVLSDAVPGGTWSSGTPGVATIGLTSGILNSVSPGTTTVTYTTATGCTATVSVTVNPLYPISGITVLCGGTTTSLSDAATPGTWSSSNVAVATIGSADGTVYGVSGGTTTITFNTPLGCSTQTTVTVNPLPVISGADSTNPDSCGVLDGKIVLNGLTQGTSYILTYNYNGTPVPAATLTAPITIASLDSGTYTNFVVQDATTGCVSLPFGPVTLSDPPNPPPPVITSNSPLCLYETLMLAASDAWGGGYYSWTGPNEFTSNIQNPTIAAATFADTGSYTVIYTLHNCLSLPATADITIEPPSPLTNVTASQTISYGSSIQLNADNAFYYMWAPDNGTLSNPNINNPVATPLITTTYTVYGMSVFGCLDSAFVTITVDSTMNIGIPTGFTPNGDGLNDLFRPVGIKFQRLVEFRVYNRWGQQVFYSNNAEHGWDGTFNGVPQDMGVYYYQIIVANPGGAGENIVYKGDVTLIR